MLVTEIKRLDSKKSLVYLNYSPAFALYKSELKRYDIVLDNELDESVYEDILRNVLRKRCRERAGYILGKSDKTEYDLRSKLKQGYYPEQIIDEVINDFIDYGYINDERFTENYVKYNISLKSKNRICNELLRKGINKDIIRNVFEEYTDENEEYSIAKNQMIEKEFKKKKYDFEKENRALLNKIISSLMRKGFGYEDIMQVYCDLKNSL